MFSRFFATSSSAPRRSTPQRSNTAPAAVPTPRTQARSPLITSPAGSVAQPITVAQSVTPASRDLSRSPAFSTSLSTVAASPSVDAPLDKRSDQETRERSTSVSNNAVSDVTTEVPMSESPITASGRDLDMPAPVDSIRVDEAVEAVSVHEAQEVLPGETKNDVVVQDAAIEEAAGNSHSYVIYRQVPEPAISDVPRPEVSVLSQTLAPASNEPIDQTVALVIDNSSSDIIAVQDDRNASLPASPQAIRPSSGLPIHEPALDSAVSTAAIPPSSLNIEPSTIAPNFLPVEAVPEPIAAMPVVLPRLLTAEDDLLGLEEATGDDGFAADHSVRTAPIFTRDALDLVGEAVLPQRALYGRVLGQHAPGFPTHLHDPKLYINTNAPFSALVCGVQVRLL
jgi:hypothetical protein